jgi:hypothetical protein
MSESINAGSKITVLCPVLTVNLDERRIVNKIEKSVSYSVMLDIKWISLPRSWTEQSRSRASNGCSLSSAVLVHLVF